MGRVSSGGGISGGPTGHPHGEAGADDVTGDSYDSASSASESLLTATAAAAAAVPVSGAGISRREKLRLLATATSAVPSPPGSNRSGRGGRRPLPGSPAVDATSPGKRRSRPASISSAHSRLDTPSPPPTPIPSMDVSSSESGLDDDDEHLLALIPPSKAGSPVIG